MRDEKYLVTFVCTGNTCRSPMADALFKADLPDKFKDKIISQSRGLAANPQDIVSQNAAEALKAYDIDIGNHNATPFNKKDLLDTDLFVCMTNEHANFLLHLGVPFERLISLEVSDPFLGSVEVYKNCAEEIKSKLWSVYEFIAESF